MHRSWLLTASMLLTAIAVLPVSAADGPSGLVVIDRQVGTGAIARNDAQVELNYTGWLYDENAKDHHGAKIDSSYDHGQTITFTLGEGKVIPGWERGIKGMRAGGKRTLLIPPKLGYGGRSVGKVVPPNASLVFDIELVSVH
ncbi:FKBP-type peptidyl-prolyl cis-trans isomerase [Rhodanobacter sp. C01]|uniref:FKBP-type peptidyl-prolyl cis-trans isomerase n=1 Tax=Rhodanobacter sp. C01 TaxID=1945856 RepID=UPI0009868F13|nr:FKBP-type peptidyl-prolyl cis-trans isomerase [Rhodanobacter sp. C01]OOG48035.1 peptidylprolyl isomerase [Rhodanobacter sp. C01]